MHVRKFEADSLEEALGNIKAQLGPDAIILKTVTNKGLKGAFKKKKIEITAAISEKNYVRKANVDNVLTEDHKSKLYSNSSSYISNIIDDYDSHNPTQKKPTTSAQTSSYGNIGINKQVQSAKDLGSKIKSGLDDFLSLGQNLENEPVDSKDFSPEPINENIQYEQGTQLQASELEEFDFGSEAFIDDPIQEPVALRENFETRVESATQSDSVSVDVQNKIDELEKQIFMLKKSIEKIEDKEAVGIYHLRTTLKSLDISTKFIHGLVRKALFELSDEELMNIDFVFEFALQEMNNCIQVAMPLFSSVDTSKPVITVFISESAVGQTKMAQKVGALRSDSVLIKNFAPIDTPTQKDEFCEKMLDMQVVHTDGVAKIVSECRKATDEGKSVFIDYKNPESEIGETKKFIEGLKRSFKNVEVLLSLSSINTEMYNRKMASRYRSLANGLIISNLDLCLNFGALFNICDEYSDLPLKFFGTGEVVPDDLEAATSERVLSGLFEF